MSQKVSTAAIGLGVGVLVMALVVGQGNPTSISINDDVAPAAVPAALDIPSIGVRTELETLRLDGNGELRPPSDAYKAGWYAGGPRPGEVGPAVIAGHRDAKVGQAVFWKLGSLRPGDPITVRGERGAVTAFRVVSVERYSRDAFPTQRVYGPTQEPALRLITCAGPYDHRRARYRENVVVFAVAA